MSTFADRARHFTVTAAKLARLRGATEEADVLERAIPTLVETGSDNWNGGIDFHTLMLELPVEHYAAIEDSRDQLEKAILKRVTPLVRTEQGNAITAIVIGPILTDEARTQPGTPTTKDEDLVPSFWQPGFFRLFISHLASNKEKAHLLKNALARYQIAAFVAHDDIEPTREWQGEIESALRTMDALTAMLEPGFVQSRWCDQEVGVALGREKLIVPLRIGADPHGFLGKYQGIQAKDVQISAVAERIFEVLIANSRSGARMTEAVVERVVTSQSWEQAKRNVALLERVPTVTSSQLSRLVQAVEENDEIKDAFGVPEKMRAAIRRLSQKVST